MQDLLHNKPPQHKRLDPSQNQKPPEFIVAPKKPTPQVALPIESKNFERIAAAAKASAKGENVRKSNAKPLPLISEEETLLPVKKEAPVQPVLHFKEKAPVVEKPSKDDIPRSQVADSGVLNKEFQ